VNVSVVICTHTERRWDSLLAAIESVRKQSRPPAEILVVVDCNRTLFRRLQETASGVVVLENLEPPGLSGARNTGARAARGEVVAFLDDDAVASPDWIESLLAGYSGSDVMGVGGPVVPSWDTTRPAWFPEEFDWVVGCTFRGMPETVSPVRALIGCNMSFRSAVFRAVGGFRADLGRVGGIPVAGEETEFCIRAGQMAPSRVWLFRPDARVTHRVPAGRATWSYFCARCYGEGLSKARIAALAGRRDGLAAERAYSLHTLPRAALTALREGIAQGDLAGPARAGAIVAGLGITALGYGHGKLRQNLGNWRSAEILRPGRVAAADPPTSQSASRSSSL
jgi:GT2 family glycosyltransferase